MSGQLAPTSRREQLQRIRDLLSKSLTLPVVRPEEYGLVLPEGETLTYAEAIVLQLVKKGAAGDLSAIRETLDRLVGKPVQTNENVNATMSYYDFLMSLVEQEQLGKDGRKVIDVKPQNDDKSQELLDDLL